MKFAKKISLFLGLFVMICFSIASAASSDVGYAPYWNNDHRYPLIWGHMNGAWYLDKDSLNVIDYNPPCYTIEISTVREYYDDKAYMTKGKQGSRTYQGESTFRIFYNLSSKKMYVDRKTGTNDWRYLPPQGSNAEAGLPMYVGEAAFYLAYNMKFYGSQKWYNYFLKKQMDTFDDSFYKACFKTA